MTFFGSLFKHRQSQRTEGNQNRSSGSSGIIEIDDPPSPTRGAIPRQESDVNIDDIMSNFKKLEEVAGLFSGEEDEEEPLSEDFLTVELPLSTIVRILPSAFAVSVNFPFAPEQKAKIIIDNVFAQLSKGRVSTPTKSLLSRVPKKYLDPKFDARSSLPVCLPLQMVVSLVDQEELRRRTSSLERESNIKNIPDVFRGEKSRTNTSSPPVADGSVEPSHAPAPPPAQPSGTSPSPISEPIPPFETPPAPPLPQVAQPQLAPVVAEATKEEESSPQLQDAKPEELVEPIVEHEEMQRPPIVEPPQQAAEPAAPEQQAEPERRMPGKIGLPLDALSEKGAPPAPRQPEPTQQADSPATEVPFFANVRSPANETPRAQSEAASGEKANAPKLVLSGIDLNTADAAELVRRLDGIGHQLAERIVADREMRGPFFDPYDLARVNGVKGRTFERITGALWHDDIHGQAATVLKVLGRWDKAPNLNEIAARFKLLPGFEACAILHKDGDVLASSWIGSDSKALGAVAPQIIKRVGQYVRTICRNDPSAVSVFVGGRLITFTQNNDICFVALHSHKGFSRKHAQIVQGVGYLLGARIAAIGMR